MKRSSRELKEIAREALLGSYGVFALAFLIYFLISFTIEMIPMLFLKTETISGLITLQIVTFILTLLIGVLAAGFQRISLNISRGLYSSVADLFYCFLHHPDRFIVVSFLITLISFALQIPTLVLGIWLISTNPAYHTPLSYVVLILLTALVMAVIAYIITLRFSLANILLIDNPQMGAIESMKTSSDLMRGNKGRYFYLSLSFIGMMLLFLSCGIGAIWVTPYMNMTYIQFYREVIGELDGGPRENNYTEEFQY